MSSSQLWARTRGISAFMAWLLYQATGQMQHMYHQIAVYDSRRRTVASTYNYYRKPEYLPGPPPSGVERPPNLTSCGSGSDGRSKLRGLRCESFWY